MGEALRVDLRLLREVIDGPHETPRPARDGRGRIGIVVGDRTIGRWQLRVSQTPWPMDFPDRKRGGVQRVIDTFGYRHTVDPAQLKQAEVVLAHLVHADVPTGRGDADQLGLRTGQQVNQRDRVVYTGVDVGENWYGGHCGNDTGPIYQCTPGTRRTTRFTGPGTRIRATAARAGRFGRRDDCCSTTGLGASSPRAAAESG